MVRPAVAIMLSKFLKRRPRRLLPTQPLLNVGCGRRRHPAWVNADLTPDGPDVLPFDIRDGLPFADQVFDVVYASHVVEHLTLPGARTFLREVCRVLRPAGVVRIVVPDLEGIARQYIEALEHAAGPSATVTERWRHRWMTLELLDQLVLHRSGGVMGRWWSLDNPPCMDFVVSRLGSEVCTQAVLRAREHAGAIASVSFASLLDDAEPSQRECAAFLQTGELHRWMYDRLSLADMLVMSGFVRPEVRGASESSIAGFSSYRLDADADGQPYKPDSLYMEAFTPSRPA